MPIYKKINKSFFKNWNQKMAYILGFLYADGNIIISKRGTCFFSIYTADKKLLEKMVKVMKSEHKISRRQKNNVYHYRIQVGSKDMFEDLIKFGLTPNKSKRMLLPEIPKRYFGDFVRGYFDGDGNVWMGLIHKQRKKKTIAIQTAFTSASVGFLKSLLLALEVVGVKKGFITISKTKTYGRLVFSKNDSLKLYEIMYNSGNNLFLARKKVVFERFMKMRS